MPAAPATDPQRILIVRLTAFGDVIHGVPALNALRDRFPDAHIAWVVEGGNAKVLDGHRALNEVIRAPRRWYKSPRAVLDLRRRLQARDFDTAIDLQSLTKSAAVAWLSGAPRRLGYTGAHGREFSQRFNNELLDVDATHVIDRYLGLLKPLGVENPVARFDLDEHDPDRDFAESLLRETGFQQSGYAVLNPGAGWPSKLWPAERYGELAQQLRSEHGLHSLAVWGVADELPLAEAIVAASDGAATLAPPTTIPQLGALCRRAALFVGSDTGPMHLSIAVGTPSLSLHGASRAEVCGAYGPLGATLQAEYTEGSHKERRRADNTAMRAITVEMAADACVDLLSRSRGSRRAG